MYYSSSDNFNIFNCPNRKRINQEIFNMCYECIVKLKLRVNHVTNCKLINSFTCIINMYHYFGHI